MIFRLAFLALVAPCAADLRGRKLAYERLAGYQPRSQVTDYAAIDLDQGEMEAELFIGRFIKARIIYEQGGNSKSYARLSLQRPHGPTKYPAGTQVFGVAPNGGETSGKLMEELVWGTNSTNVTALVLYDTSDIQADYVGCRVGGLYAFHDANLDGCFNTTGHVTFARPGISRHNGTVYAYKYDIRKDNDNLRTLKSLSSKAEETMRKGGECSVCPYIDDFQTYLDFYGTPAYGDHWVSAAFYNTSTDFGHGYGNADFSKFKFNTALAEAVRKGTVFLNLYMAVIREMEDAITDCSRGCEEDCNADPVESIDAAVAFYAGSLQGEDGSGEGVLLYNLANEQAMNFATAGEFGTDETGTAYINIEVIREFKKMQLNLMQKQCEAARTSKNKIVNYMKVPMIQGVLRYAYTRTYEKPSIHEDAEKVEAEGATYAAAILPYIHKCDDRAAVLVHRHMKVGGVPHFPDLKATLESTYNCLNIQCGHVGGVWTVSGYAEGAEPCTVPGTSSSQSKASSSSVAAGATIGTILGLVVLMFVVLRVRRRRRNRSERQDSVRRSGNIAAVSEIS